MRTKPLTLATLTPAERQVIVDTIKQHDVIHKDIILEVFDFIESLVEDLKNSKITISVLKSRLLGFMSERAKKEKQTP